MEKGFKKIDELNSEIIKLLKENDKITKKMREKGVDVSKYRNFLKEVG